MRIAAAGGNAQALATHLARPELLRRSFWERLLACEYRDFASARDAASSDGITLAQRYVAVSLELDAAADDDTASSTLLASSPYASLKAQPTVDCGVQVCGQERPLQDDNLARDVLTHRLP